MCAGDDQEADDQGRQAGQVRQTQYQHATPVDGHVSHRFSSSYSKIHLI